MFDSGDDPKDCGGTVRITTTDTPQHFREHKAIWTNWYEQARAMGWQGPGPLAAKEILKDRGHKEAEGTPDTLADRQSKEFWDTIAEWLNDPVMADGMAEVAKLKQARDVEDGKEITARKDALAELYRRWDLKYGWIVGRGRSQDHTQRFEHKTSIANGGLRPTHDATKLPALDKTKEALAIDRSTLSPSAHGKADRHLTDRQIAIRTATEHQRLALLSEIYLELECWEWRLERCEPDDTEATIRRERNVELGKREAAMTVRPIATRDYRIVGNAAATHTGKTDHKFISSERALNELTREVKADLQELWDELHKGGYRFVFDGAHLVPTKAEDLNPDGHTLPATGKRAVRVNELRKELGPDGTGVGKPLVKDTQSKDTDDNNEPRWRQKRTEAERLRRLESTKHLRAEPVDRDAAEEWLAKNKHKLGSEFEDLKRAKNLDAALSNQERWDWDQEKHKADHGKPQTADGKDALIFNKRDWRAPRKGKNKEPHYSPNPNPATTSDGVIIDFEEKREALAAPGRLSALGIKVDHPDKPYKPSDTRDLEVNEALAAIEAQLPKSPPSNVARIMDGLQHATWKKPAGSSDDDAFETAGEFNTDPEPTYDPREDDRDNPSAMSFEELKALAKKCGLDTKDVTQRKLNSAWAKYKEDWHEAERQARLSKQKRNPVLVDLHSLDRRHERFATERDGPYLLVPAELKGQYDWRGYDWWRKHGMEMCAKTEEVRQNVAEARYEIAKQAAAEAQREPLPLNEADHLSLILTFLLDGTDVCFTRKVRTWTEHKLRGRPQGNGRTIRTMRYWLPTTERKIVESRKLTADDIKKALGTDDTKKQVLDELWKYYFQQDRQLSEPLPKVDHGAMRFDKETLPIVGSYTCGYFNPYPDTDDLEAELVKWRKRWQTWKHRQKPRPSPEPDRFDNVDWIIPGLLKPTTTPDEKD